MDSNPKFINRKFSTDFLRLFPLIFVFGCAQAPNRAVSQMSEIKSKTSNNASQCSDSVRLSKYMSGRNCFLNSEKDVLGTPEQNLFDQNMATVFSYVGDEQKSRQIFDRLNTSTPSNEMIDKSQFIARGASGEIVARVKNRQVIVVNEAHHVPQTRLLTLQLLKPLYDQGFRYLAAETFDDQALPQTIQQGFPTQETGYYTAEPTYSLIVREALKLGYKLIAYESSPQCDPFHDPPEKCQNLREEGQAKNLYERIFRNDPRAKVIIHAGYGHIDKKGSDDPSWKWIPMARYLWDLTKIEPYSVDQTFFFEKGQTQLNSKLYEEVVNGYKLREPAVLIDKIHGEPFVASHYQGHYDAQVFLPPLSDTDGRPAWRKLIPGSRKVQLEHWRCPKKSECLVQALMEQERDAHFVPIDQALITGTSVTLYLQPGKYSVRLVDEQDIILSERYITVP